MKHLPIKSPPYRYIIQSFRDWLDVLGYSEQTVYNLPHYVQEFLHYMESQGYSQIKDIENRHFMMHYNLLKQRGNTRQQGGLSNAYLNKQQQALQKFSDYLRQSGRLDLPKLLITAEETDHLLKDILTQQEIKQLYELTDKYPAEHKRIPWMYEAIASRDRAMLTVLYGCGLRRTEAVYLDLSDIHADKGYIHVRKGKNYKERLVPINAKGLQYLQDYLYQARPHFVKEGNKHEEAFFISSKGKRISGQGLLVRLNQLLSRTQDPELQQKTITLHTLRHSIATHLLQNGMPLENIAEFLGHNSLESTQIYTRSLPFIKQPEQHHE